MISQSRAFLCPLLVFQFLVASSEALGPVPYTSFQILVLVQSKQQPPGIQPVCRLSHHLAKHRKARDQDMESSEPLCASPRLRELCLQMGVITYTQAVCGSVRTIFILQISFENNNSHECLCLPDPPGMPVPFHFME